MRPVAAGLDDGARRGRAARVRLLAGRQRPRGRLRRRPAPHATSRPTSCTWPPGPRLAAGSCPKISLAEHLGALRTCFERLTEWDGDDVPAAVLVFSGDLPLPRRAVAPVPRRRRVHQAAAGHPRRPRPVRPPVPWSSWPAPACAKASSSISPSTPSCRSAPPTGCTCRSASCAPTATSRCTPSSRTSSTTGSPHRPASLRSRYLFIEHGQRIGQGRVDRAVAKAASAAGIGHVTPASGSGTPWPPRRSTGA